MSVRRPRLVFALLFLALAATSCAPASDDALQKEVSKPLDAADSAAADLSAATASQDNALNALGESEESPAEDEDE